MGQSILNIVKIVLREKGGNEMKKIIGLFLSVCLLISLVACGGSNSASGNKTLSLGESVSSDIVDLTIDKAELAFFASSSSNDYTAPIDSDSGGIFHTNKGYTFVCMNFVVVNKDRGSINLGGVFSDWPLMWKVKYKGKEYSLNSYDLNNPAGGNGLNFRFAKTGPSYEIMIGSDTDNVILGAGESLYVQTLGIVNFEAENLSDEFELIVSVPSSSGEYVRATYKVN